MSSSSSASLSSSPAGVAPTCFASSSSSAFSPATPWKSSRSSNNSLAEALPNSSVPLRTPTASHCSAAGVSG
eukprot:4448306-Amphidinium_carterae.1